MKERTADTLDLLQAQLKSAGRISAADITVALNCGPRTAQHWVAMLREHCECHVATWIEHRSGGYFPVLEYGEGDDKPLRWPAQLAR